MDAVNTFVENVSQSIVDPLIQLMIGVAALVFLWGVVEYLINGNNPEKRSQGARHILWGLIGLAIMFSVQGIIAFIESFVQG